MQTEYANCPHGLSWLECKRCDVQSCQHAMPRRLCHLDAGDGPYKSRPHTSQLRSLFSSLCPHGEKGPKPCPQCVRIHQNDFCPHMLKESSCNECMQFKRCRHGHMRCSACGVSRRCMHNPPRPACRHCMRYHNRQAQLLAAEKQVQAKRLVVAKSK
jgi:hypothetical protein